MTPIPTRQSPFWLACGVVASATLFAWPSAQADPPYQIEVRSRVLLGQESPALILHAIAALKGVEVRLQMDGRPSRTHRVASLPAGSTHEFPVDAPAGATSWTAEVRHVGAREADVLTFDVIVARPIEIRIGPGDVDLARGEVSFTASEPVARARIAIFAEDGSPILTREDTLDAPAQSPIRMRFDPPRDRVGRLVLTAFDAHGFFNGVEARPFFVEVPHEEVLFDFDRAEIRASEEPKMTRTLGEIHAALVRLSSAFSARLYVAGYTDTSGSHDHNRDLSRRRAEAIARWFRAHGLRIGVCWQGFGEDALAVPTPDETPEPRNRRSLYVLADQPPPVSRTFPAADWRCAP